MQRKPRNCIYSYLGGHGFPGKNSSQAKYAVEKRIYVVIQEGLVDGLMTVAAGPERSETWLLEEEEASLA